MLPTLRVPPSPYVSFAGAENLRYGDSWMEAGVRMGSLIPGKEKGRGKKSKEEQKERTSMEKLPPGFKSSSATGETRGGWRLILGSQDVFYKLMDGHLQNAFRAQEIRWEWGGKRGGNVRIYL